MSISIADQVRLARTKPIIKSAFDLLARKLPASLKYHTAEHTDDVVHEVILFSNHDQLPAEAVELLTIAAAYHDLGFIESTTNNETIAARMAAEAMQKDGAYNVADIEAVRSMIIDTTLHFTPEGPRQIPHSVLAKYLLDADVSNLGREDFFEKAELVRQELDIRDETQFLTGLITFTRAHIWYSPAAKALRQAKKLENMARLTDLVARL